MAKSRNAYFVVLFHYFWSTVNPLFCRISCSQRLLQCLGGPILHHDAPIRPESLKNPFRYRLFGAAWVHTLGATSLHHITFLWPLPSTNCSKFRVFAHPGVAGGRTLVFTDILIANAKCESGDILAPATAHTPKNTILDQNVPKSLKILKKPLIV